MPGSAIRKTQAWLQDVGIIAMEVYFPSTYVEQSELEQFDSVSSGKYTIGLGQSKMGFCSDREDVNSLCLTVVKRLMERNNISYSDIGRMEVGTETIIDKSKSVKTVLMQLFEESGNFSVEGIDTTNACYGGTSALFNAVNWIESSYWDGRYALVVAGDIAVYATGNARCTGGAGAIAMLLGPNAPLIFDRGVRATYMQHAYDFYKPDMASEYPVVDGRLSIQCYLTALDRCYQSLKAKAHQMELCTDAFTLESASAFLFHSPYCKLVQKSFARLMLNDFLQDKNPDFKGKYAGLEAFRDVKLENSHFNKQVEQAFMKASDSLFKAKTMPSLLLANQVGNMYTPSLYGGLVAFLSAHLAAELFGKRLVFFSYGSGLASSMFSMHITDNRSLDSRLDGLLNGVRDLRVRLDARKKVAPKDFEKTMRLREETHHKPHYTPVGSVDDLFPGTWYLTHVDNMHRRKYERKPLIANEANSPVGSVSVPDLPDVRKAAAEEQVSRSPAPVSS